MPANSDSADFDDQDLAEVFDDTNLTDDGADIANFDDIDDVYDATRADGDADEDDDYDDFDPDDYDEDDEDDLDGAPETEAGYADEDDEDEDEGTADLDGVDQVSTRDRDRLSRFESSRLSDDELRELGYADGDKEPRR